MNVNSLITKDYRKKDDFAVQKNKPNSNPIKPNFKQPLQKKLVFQALVSYKMQQTRQAITNWQLQIGNRKFNALEAVFGADSVGTI